MLKRVLVVTIFVTQLASVVARAQSSCGSTKLYCLIPTVFHTPVNEFNFLNEAFGTQVAQLPLASPASGFVYGFDKSGVYTSSSESFGPLLAERSETIGRHKFYVAFTYQRFAFSNLDGNDMKNIPVLFSYPSATNPQFDTVTQNRIDAKIDQFVAFATFGLASRLDVSVAVPFERISMGVSSVGTEFSTTTTATASFTEFLPGSAHGIGDVLLSAKGTVLKREHFGIAAGIEGRFPTGDERNFLGSGSYGVKPFLILSRRGRFAPHVNIGYQWNSSSFLAANASGVNQSLPGDFTYAGGADMGITKRFTLGLDVLGQHFFNAPQISKPLTLMAVEDNAQIAVRSVQQISGAYDIYNFSAGVKINPVGHLLMSANALVKLNDSGLRSRVVPLVGISYTF